MTPRPKLQAHPGQLDPLSRNTIAGCGVRLCLALGLVFWPVLTGWWPMAKAMETLSLCLSASSMVASAAAIWRGETFNGPSLNRWDESLLFLGLARLAHLAQAG